MDRKTREQFRKNVEVDPQTGCWIWTGTRHPAGYGRFYDPSRQQTLPAHYITLELYTGKRVPRGLECHHKCGNKSCVNPKHLQLVTHAEHFKIHAKAGAWSGSRNGRSKLTEDQVLAMRAMDEIGIFPKLKLAEAFGVPYRTFRYAVSGEGWKIKNR